MYHSGVYMSFEWLEYLDLADNILNQTPVTEAKRRCSISRAYYAVFCKSRNYLINEGEPDKALQVLKVFLLCRSLYRLLKNPGAN